MKNRYSEKERSDILGELRKSDLSVIKFAREKLEDVKKKYEVGTIKKTMPNVRILDMGTSLSIF